MSETDRGDNGPRAAQCIELTGEQARAFAQAQFSGDVDALLPGRWQWNAWLDAQGRVRALIQLARIDDANGDRLIALLRGGDASAICNALQRYVLRARANLQPMTPRFCRIGGELALNEVRMEGDAIGFGYGDRSLWLVGDGAADLPIGSEREQAFRLADIRAGWPSLPQHAEPVFLPPALGLEHLGAVSFNKGCYPGQEIAARLHYRGGHKMHLCRIASTSHLIPGPMSGGSGRDTILDVAFAAEGYEALAVLEASTIHYNNGLDDILNVVERFSA